MRNPWGVTPSRVQAVTAEIDKLCAQGAMFPKPEQRNLPEDFPYFSHIARGFSKLDALCEAQNHRCAYCGNRFDKKNRPSLDEVIPRILGGCPIWSNQVAACITCNGSRGAVNAERYHAVLSERGTDAAMQWAAREHAKAASIGWMVLA